MRKCQIKRILNKCHANDAAKTGSLMLVDFPISCRCRIRKKSNAKNVATRSYEAQMQRIKHSRTPALDANAFLEHTRSQRTKQCQAPRLQATATQKDATSTHQARCSTKNRVSGNSIAHSSLQRLSSRAAATAHSAFWYRHSSYIGTR